MLKYLKNYNNKLHEEVNTHVEQYKIAQEKLLEENNKAQRYLDLAGNIIVALDNRGNISLINKHGADLLESTESDLLGHNWFDGFLVTEELETVKSYFNDLMQGNLEAVKHVENKIKTTKGNILDISWHNSLIYEDNQIVGALSSGTNITQQKEYEHSIIKAKELADAANSAKSNFLASMSHEIRTPMTGLLGFIERLKNTESNPERIKQFNVIENSGQTLLAIINDILDFSKIESGKIELESSPYKLHKIFNSSIDIYATLASSKNISLHSMIDENLPTCLIGDETRLKQVIFNLLSNAIKFTNEQGKVTLNANYNTEKQTLYIAVVDTGVGIAKENIERIFEAFAQEDVSTTRKFGGTGLGLSISLHLVKAMGGEIKVESVVGEGSKFSFEIPIDQCTEELVDDKVLKDVDIEAPSNFKAHALIVEDNKTNQMLMSIILDDLGMTYDIANNGAEGVMSFKLTKYDVILMDENMPIMNGIESTKHIREIEKETQITATPIIAVTANALTGDKEKFIEAGMNDYIPKPYSEEDIVKVLQKYLS